MNIPQIYLVEPYNAYAPKGKKKHLHEILEEQALLARIIAEQQARQEAELQAIIQEAKSRTLPPQAPPESVPTIVGNSAGAGAAGAEGSAPGGGGMPVWDFWNPKGDVVNFSFTPTGGPAPLTVQFTNLTTTPQFDSYLWTFGDGTTSTDTNPTHVYQSGSTEAPYTCSLQTTNSVTGLPGTSSLPQYISASIPTVTAAFTFTTGSNIAPFTASFVNTTVNTSQTPTTTYKWIFTYTNAAGAATTTTSAVPSGYTRRIDSGSFTASLQATGSYGITSLYTRSFAAPAPTLAAGFTFTTSSNFAPSNATFLSNNTYNGAGGLTYFWNLGSGSNFPSGDNSASVIPNPPNTYTVGGPYTASYAITESLYGIKSSYTQSFRLQQPVLTISFSVNTGSGNAPQWTPFRAYVNYDGPGALAGTWRFGELREDLTEWTNPYSTPTGTSFTYETRSATGQDGRFTASLEMTAAVSGITAFYTQSFYITKPLSLGMTFTTHSFGFDGAENSYMDPVTMSYTASTIYDNEVLPPTLLYKWDFGSASFFNGGLGVQTGTSTAKGPHLRADYFQIDGAHSPYTASLQVTGSYGLMARYTQSFLVSS